MKRVCTMRTFYDALQTEEWIGDITGPHTVPLIRQPLRLIDCLEHVNTVSDQQDQFIWRWASSGIYSAASAYHAFFIGQYSIAGAKELAMTRAPPKVKFFLWLVLHSRCWTNDRICRHNICSTTALAPFVLTTRKRFNTFCWVALIAERWFKLLRRSGHQGLTPQANQEIADWWTQARKLIPKQDRKGLDSLALTAWEIWKERNRRVFDGISRQLVTLSQDIVQEGCFLGAGWILGRFVQFSLSSLAALCFPGAPGYCVIT